MGCVTGIRRDSQRVLSGSYSAGFEMFGIAAEWFYMSHKNTNQKGALRPRDPSIP